MSDRLRRFAAKRGAESLISSLMTLVDAEGVRQKHLVRRREAVRPLGGHTHQSPEETAMWGHGKSESGICTECRVGQGMVFRHACSKMCLYGQCMGNLLLFR